MRRLFLASLVFISSLGFAHEGDDENYKKNCEKLLKASAEIELITAYNRYKKINRPYGVEFRLKEGPKDSPVHVRFGQNSPQIARPETWVYNHKFYRFLDVGFKNLEDGVKSINQIVARHVLKFSNRDLLIDYEPDRIDTLTRLTQYRWFVQDAVVNRYRLIKKHLNDKDYFYLNWTDRRSFNSDIFAVLLGGVDPILSRRGVHDDLAVTIQVNYPGFFDFLSPNLIGVIESQKLKPIVKDVVLPFEFRLHSSIAKMFRYAFYERFPRDRTCEFTQYAIFQDVPFTVLNRLIYEAFGAVVRRNMKVIVIVTDSQTEFLFRQFGFRSYLPLLTKQQKEPEQLMYLETDSEEFRYQYQRLRDATKNLTILQE